MALTKVRVGGVDLTTDDNNPQLTLKSTDADANAGPILVLNRDSGSPADNDLIGKVQFSADDDGGNSLDYATINIKATDVSDGSEDGEFDISTVVAGTSRSRMRADGTETIFNENSVDVDFRVESNGNANMLIVDGALDTVLIGTNAEYSGTGADLTVNKAMDVGDSSSGDNATIAFTKNASTGTIGSLQSKVAGFGNMPKINLTATNVGGGSQAGEIEFYTTTGASIAERMRVDSSGNVLIGKTATGTSNTGCQFEGSGTGVFSRSGDICMVLNRETNAGECVSIRQGGTAVGGIDANSSSVDFNTSSDYRLKENVTTSWDATTRLKQLKPVRFSWKVDSKSEADTDGFLAHEVSSVVPEATSGEKDAVDADGNPKHQGIDHSKLVALLVKTVQELEARIATLESK
tara:strand:+ start:26 stop:1246 length:1221 start_codon:yes stop_codon:yes gene_type:complete